MSAVATLRVSALACVAALGGEAAALPQAQKGDTPPAIREILADRDIRLRLFDELVRKTRAREAWSKPKNVALGLDPEAAMQACRAAFEAATTQQDLICALVRLSCSRRDRHLSVRSVKGGLQATGRTRGSLPVRFDVSYDVDKPWTCFVAQVDASIQAEGENKLEVGDVVVGVGGKSFEAWCAEIQPYLRSSTKAGLWREYAKALSTRSWRRPAQLNPDLAKLRLRKASGATVDVELPYSSGLRFWPAAAPYSADFELVLDVQTFDLYRHKSEAVLVLDWYGFREDLVEDMDRLVALAKKKGWLDHALIWDGTKSRGGSRGAYAIQRLFSKPFRTTFGNLRLSDVVPPFIAKVRARQRKRKVLDGGVQETMDNGAWLLSWLEDDVTKGMARGQDYSNNVPFKLAHLPK